MSTSLISIALGLDVGGTKMKAVALQLPDIVLAETVIPSNANEGPDAVRQALNNAVRHFQDQGIVFQSLGIGCAGSVDPQTGVVRNSPNFSNWKNIPLRTWAEKDFGVPVSVENDANCAVLCEWKIGAGKGDRNVVLLTLGTGVGGGLILDGKLFRGSTGTGGELGHFSIHANGIICPCGNRGCFERYCSASSVKFRAHGVSPRTVFMEANKNNEFRKIVFDFITDFQIGLTSIANIFDPDCILLGGAVSEGVEPYLNELQSWVSSHAFPAVGDHIKLKMTKYKNLSGAMGAALLSIN